MPHPIIPILIAMFFVAAFSLSPLSIALSEEVASD